MFGEQRLTEYPPGVLEEGTTYGYPKELWDTFTPQQKEVAAAFFAFAVPELAIAAGAQEILDHGTLSLKAKNLIKKTTE